MDEIEAILRQQLPPDFIFSKSDESLTIRDSNVERGKGYLIRIIKEPRYLNVKIEFENFAKHLIEYSENQLISERKLFSDLLLKYPSSMGKIYRQSTENIASPEIISSESWWLTLEYKLNEDLTQDYWNFSDILLCYIFLLFPYDVEGEEEGNTYDVLGTKQERSRLNRALCLAFHGYNCKACDVNMRKMYSNLGNEYIQVHHINPVSVAGINRPDPLKNLVPLCPNCHSVAHLKKPPYTVQEIRDMINKSND